MKMAEDHSGGILLQTEVESSDMHLGEETFLSTSYNHQLVTESSVQESETKALCETQKVTEMPSIAETESRDLCDVSTFNYGTLTHVKRTRGRPRKDCQRPVKHHLGQSVASKVFPGRPRFRGRKFHNFLMTHAPHKLPDIHSTVDVYEDIDSDLKSSCEIPEKLLVSSDALPDNELKIEKFCALCNLSEKSLLGQGKLKHFKPSEGFHCFEAMEQKGKSKSVEVTTTSDTGTELKLFFKKQKLINNPGGEQIKIHRPKSLQNFTEKPSMLTDLIQELEVTGFKVVPEICDIFEQSGELYAHFNCAAWSESVTKTFEKLLSNVDKAVVTAAFQKCSKCGRFGASVRCCVSDCTKIYHYPCAIVSGALQNANCFKIICSIHLEDAFSFGVICMACHESGDLSQLLLCTSCSNYYHGTCMDPPITPSSDVRAGWQCLECKVCQNCRQPGDSSKMIICNTCDKGFHMFCVKPAISSVPKSGWKCSACRKCGDCGARTPGSGPSSRWHLNYSVCDSCYQQRNKGIACPLCGKAYRQFSQKKGGMKHCTICQKYIHEECDKRTRRNSMDYVCPICVTSEGKHIEVPLNEHSMKETYASSSRDSFLSGNEESPSSDSDDGYDGVSSKISSRRTSANELRNKKSSKPKYKAFSIPNFMYPMSAAQIVSQKEYKIDDDDPTEDNKLILGSAADEFVLCQDLCVMCGSFGRGEEGRLISCAQCGQCYHSYCVSVKVTTVVLKKGWRCLDCTVCEGCGQPHDEGRLLLCDECDISFHIYCLDPPLQEVPQGNWKCKWCVNCVKCGSKSPGVNCDWQVNHTLCGPCASFSSCCLCQQHYEEDELVIQCNKCERWLHGMCDQIDTEDHAEKCAEYGYTCPLCRSPDELPPHLLPQPRTPTPEIEVVPEKHASPIAKPKEPEPPPVKQKHPVQFFLDGVCLSESGMQYIKSLAPEQPKKIPRPRRIKQLSDGTSPVKAFSLQLNNEDSTSAVGAEDTKMDAATLEEMAMKAYDFDESKLVIDSSKEDDKKKRPRKLQKLGIGGFNVKPRGRISSGKDAAAAEPLEVNMSQTSDLPAVPTVQPETCTPTVEGGSEQNSLDKPKRKRKTKKKTHLDECFPSYLRDAFFGKELLLSCKKLSKSAESPEADIKGDSMSKGNSETIESKPSIRMQEDMKDLACTPALSKSKDATNANTVYKNLIKSEIESIKEEHLCSASVDSSVYNPNTVGAPKVAPYSSATQPPSMHSSVLQTLHHPDSSNSSWGEGDCVDQSQMQKNILKWESDEHLGLLSTISPVLYANINLPHLKIEFPAWADRVKQIAKIWRGLPSEKRQPYLQRARENRAASRTQQRSSSSESMEKSHSHPSPKSSSDSCVDPEKQWKQFQAMRQLQHQAQQRALQEQRVQQTTIKLQTDKPIGSPAVADVRLFHSKSMSEIPQFPSSSMDDKDNRKVFEKRWSSSALDVNAAQGLMQSNKVKIEVPNPTSFPKDNMQHSSLISARSSVVHSPRIQPSLEPHLTIPDAVVPPSPIIKQSDPFASSTMMKCRDPFPSVMKSGNDSYQIPSSSSMTTSNMSHIQKSQMSITTDPLLLRKEEVAARVPTPKDVASTPPATPRPHSSDSFFQLSPSPQSQLLASLDSHSQPTPGTNQNIGVTASNADPIKPAASKVIESASKVFNQANKMVLQPPSMLSPKSQQPSLPQNIQQFVLQQGSLTPANIAKQLSQYKETLGSLSGNHSSRSLLNQDKPIEQQNLEHFLKEGSLNLPFQSKGPQHQQLRDLLQNKKYSETVSERNLEGTVTPQASTPNLNVSSSNTSCTLSISTATAGMNTVCTTGGSFEGSRSISQASCDKHGSVEQASKSKKVINADLDNVLPMVSDHDESKDNVCPDLNKKRKTTAGDLVKDLETEPEEHDVIAANCSLDVLSTDVGELELDDDELLGLGNDFNILEYADPELDKSLVGEGDKNNILDEHLDLDDKDEELEEDVIKESSQEKDLMTHNEKKEMEIENDKCKDSLDLDKETELPENFLDFNKKDLETEAFESSFQSKALESCSDDPPLEPIINTVKKEPKQAFSSCSLSTSTFSPSVDIKLEKTTGESCPISKSHSISCVTDTPVVNVSRLQCPDSIVPPPSYRMVTNLKQTLASHSQNTLVQQNKSLFPLHLNMGMRQDLALSQQNVMSSNVVDSSKPLLLQEQPLLLAELVEQEKREQRRQTQEGIISPHGDALLSDIDFERLKDDVFSGPPDDSLGGPGSFLGPHESSLSGSISPSVGVPSSPSSHNFGPPPYSLLWQNPESSGTLASRPVSAGFIQNIKKTPPVSATVATLGLPCSTLVQKAPTLPGSMPTRPFHPNFTPISSVDLHPMDPEKLKLLNYEKHLLQQQAILTSQQKYFETEVIKLRKVKKALNAKQRQLRKNGSELTENDSMELARVSQEQAGLQKQLDQVRKQTRQNALAIQDYRLKQQKKQQLLQQPQQVSRSPMHPSVSSVQSSPQNSQSPLQFSHAATTPASPSPSVRMQSPSHLPQQPSSGSHNLQSSIFSVQSSMPVSKAENTSWSGSLKISQGELQVPAERFLKREPSFDRNIGQSAAFPLNTTSQGDNMTLKSLIDVKKNLTEEILTPSISSNVIPSIAPKESLEPSGFSAGKPGGSDMIPAQTLIKDQKLEVLSTTTSTASQSILSQSLPSSVSNTLKFTLRQTGMPTGCLPTDATNENANELNYNLPSKTETVVLQEAQLCKENNAECAINENVVKQEGSSTNEDIQKEPNMKIESTSQKLPEILNEGGLLIRIKQEIVDDAVTEDNFDAQKKEAVLKEKEGSTQKKDDTNEESSDEELENLTKMAVSTSEAEQGGEQNVLLKQLLQNCPSADTPRKTTDNFIQSLRKENEDSDKLELPFDVDDATKSKLVDNKQKKPTYLDIRRAQLDREPTPPPGEKQKALKRKRPKKKKLEQPGSKPEGILAKKKCRRASSKIEEGYETYVETLMNKLTSLPPLRILEPNIKPNFSVIPVFGAGDLNVKENQLKGRYGSATVPGQVDIYSFYPYISEQPPSSALLPPSSPPYRGFYNQEFPAITKAFEKNEMALALKPTLDSELTKIARDAGSPDTVVSSSSPESCLFEPLCKWPRLVFVDKLMPENKRSTHSPIIPLMHPVPIRLYPKEWGDLDEDKDKENIPDEKMEIGLIKTKMSGIGGYSAPLKDSGNVAVTLTLSSAAAEDICGVLSALADLLKIPIPASYEIVERTATPPSQKLGLYRRSKNSEVSIHSLLNGKPRFCRHCDIVVLSAGIRKKASDLPCISKEEQEEEEEVIFCSTNCYMQFALTHRSTAILEEKEAAAVVDHTGERTLDKDSKYFTGEDSLGALIMDEKDSLEIENFKPEEMDVCEADSLEENAIDSVLSLAGDDKYLSSNNPYDIDLLTDKMEICEEEPIIRKWKTIKYKYWSPDDMLVSKAKRKDDTNEKAVRPFYHIIKPNQMPKDERKCIFCHITGDGDTNGAARLLNMDVNKYVHLNCALWSYEVYETVNGALMNVEVAFKRSRHLTCYSCHKQGASVRCFKTRCPNIYHFPCAKREQCAFFKDKTVLCPQHVHKGNPDNRLDSTAVFRRVYINREEHKQVASMIQDEKYVMRVGSLIFLNIGQLLPQQIQAFHTSNCIYPVGYKVIRMYWSMRKLGRRSQYICTINEVSGKPEFCIQVKEPGPDQKGDIILKDKTAKGVWQKVLYPIEKMRKQAKTIKIFPDFITGDDLFGLTEPAVLRIVESLPGVDTLFDYNFRYGRSPFLELPLAINPTGCARSEPKLRTHFKRPHTLRSTSNSATRSFHSAFAGCFYPEVSSPYIKQFVHSKSSQYRKMKTEWRNNVYLARSRIQGLGLYAARDMEKHTMVIEYIGQLIRNEIAERNEAIYDAQNRGVYMFRLDENRVIDATLCGGLARYINHSCNPNCTTEAVQIDREIKIIIITNRKVLRGEELSYDYKFEVEDDQHKIPCLCGAPNCRKWMN